MGKVLIRPEQVLVSEACGVKIFLLVLWVSFPIGMETKTEASELFGKGVFHKWQSLSLSGWAGKICQQYQSDVQRALN